jgi:hypothetical protein
MGMLKKFASIAFANNYGYAYDSEAWDYNSIAFLDKKYRMFQTYGDGLCQHSGDWPVAEEYAIDYLNSLAVVLLQDEELAEHAMYGFQTPARKEVIEFAASLVYDPKKDAGYGKARYYRLQHRKVTRNQDKAHDDRYKELHQYLDGSPESIFSVMVEDYASGQDRYHYACALRAWLEENRPKVYMEMPCRFLKWFKESTHTAREFRDAHEACFAACQIVEDRKRETMHIENYRRRVEAGTVKPIEEPLLLTA